MKNDGNRREALRTFDDVTLCDEFEDVTPDPDHDAAGGNLEVPTLDDRTDADEDTDDDE
jgi:hypothetical protein